jgi:hypothetical protein
MSHGPGMNIATAVLQYLLAAGFVLVPIIAYRYGNKAQEAAEAEVAKQGFPPGLLLQHGVKIKESSADTLFPFAIALCFAALATLNLAGADIGRLLSWIVQPIFLVAGGLTTAGQVFVTRFVESSFKKANDPALRGINVQAFIDAATSVFPRGFRAIIITRFLLTTIGSALVIILLYAGR